MFFYKRELLPVIYLIIGYEISDRSYIWIFEHKDLQIALF